MEVAYILQKYYSLTPNSLTPALSKGEGEGSYLSFFFSFFLPLLWRGLG